MLEEGHDGRSHSSVRACRTLKGAGLQAEIEAPFSAIDAAGQGAGPFPALVEHVKRRVEGRSADGQARDVQGLADAVDGGMDEEPLDDQAVGDAGEINVEEACDPGPIVGRPAWGL
jgi:hypothetical protein